MKIKHVLMAVLCTLVLTACGGDRQEQASSAGGNKSNNADSGVLGFVEFDGERYDLVWTSCANRPESHFQRWLAESGDEINFRFQRYELRPGQEEHRYSINFTRIGRDSWENIFSHPPTISITEKAVEGDGVVYPRGVSVRDRDDSLVPIRFEFTCRPRA